MSESHCFRLHSRLTFMFSHDDMRVIHHRDVRPETMTRYTRVISCLILLVLRCHTGWDSEYTMKLTKQQSDASRELLHVLPQPTTSRLDEFQADFSNHDADDRDHLNNQEEPLDDPDGEVYDDFHSLFDDDLLLSPDSEIVDEISDTPVQARLLDLLLSLYTHLPSGKDNKFWSPILRFIVLYSMKKDGGWLPARQITQIFAALLFCGRLLMMVLMHRKVLSDPSLRYSAYVKSLPNVTHS